MMRTLRKLRVYVVMGVVSLLFVWTIWESFSSIVQLQGNARVINYTGIVRGGTQRLVKQELHGQANDAVIVKLDGIIDELIQGDGEGKNGLIALTDSAFQANMTRVLEQWTDLKREITAHRSRPTEPGLYLASERYFDLVNETASLAEVYTESQVSLFKLRLRIFSGIFGILFFSAIAIAVRTVALKRRAEILSAIAYVDPLTGIPNRAACHRKLASLAQSNAGGELAVFVFDMNDLKRANDELGHSEGDKIIAAFGHILQNTFGGVGFVGRYGGDEFIAFLRGNAFDAESMMTSLRQNVDAYNKTIPDAIRRVRFAGGFAAADIRTASIDELLKDADRNMYSEKRNSRESIVDRLMEQVADASQELVQVAGRVNAFSQDLTNSAESERSLLTELSQAAETLQNHAVDYTRLAMESSAAIVEIRDRADNGKEDMQLLAGQMEDIDANGKEMHSVLKAIEEIAFQTRILSINAAIEAAKAGKYGKGFSVIADEVRKLASQSEKSVKVTDTALSHSDELVEAGVSRSHSTSDHLVKIAEASHRTDKLMGEVSARALEQQTIVTTIASELSSVAKVASRNSEAAIGNAKAARMLFELANRMRKMLNYGREVNTNPDGIVQPFRQVG